MEGCQSQALSFQNKTSKKSGDAFTGRKAIMFLTMMLSWVYADLKTDGLFYKNSLCDEIIFIHEGSGQLQSQLGYI